MSVIERTCRYRDCERAARDSWTTCSRHYSAGRAYRAADENAELRQQLAGAVEMLEWLREELERLRWCGSASACKACRERLDAALTRLGGQ
jgi:hypothetical protein